MSGDIAANEIHKLRNEIARLKNQTNWVCKCGGTDCEGQRENAALRAELDWKTERLKLLSDCLHNIDGLIKTAATSIFVDAIDAARKEAQP